MARQMISFGMSNGLDGVPQRLLRSRAYRELRRVPEALADCRAALSEAPQDPGLLTLEALLLLANGRPEDAAAASARFKALWPDLPAANGRRFPGTVRPRTSIGWRFFGALRSAVSVLRRTGAGRGMRPWRRACRGLGRFVRAPRSIFPSPELDPQNRSSCSRASAAGTGPVQGGPGGSQEPVRRRGRQCRGLLDRSCRSRWTKTPRAPGVPPGAPPPSPRIRSSCRPGGPLYRSSGRIGAQGCSTGPSAWIGPGDGRL
jgi:hypothetical protein